MLYSEVICIGDSYTNEHTHYQNVGIDKEFINLNYEFKSYPQLLGEKYNCKWETFGAPGMPMPYSLQILIDKIDYIQSLENPLVIYQFGFFDNLTMSLTTGNYTEWKDLVLEGMGGPSQNNSKILEGSGHCNVNPNTQFELYTMNKLERVGMVTFLEKFGSLTNFHLIEQFLSIAKLIKRTKKIDIYGLFMAHNKSITVPKHNNILYMGQDGYALDGKETLDHIYPQFKDQHKTTTSNQQISDEIYWKLLKKTDINEYIKKNGLKSDKLI
tara:strand:- start:780 stop:1589 length:810 start_codon:yes stop_codon:yes gene_type:complete